MKFRNLKARAVRNDLSSDKRQDKRIKKWVFFLAILIACILEVSALNYLRVFNIKPNLLLIAVVIASLMFEAKWALLFSILSGALKDVFCPAAFPSDMVLFGLWSYLIIRLSRKINLDVDYIRACLVFIVVIVNAIVLRLSFAYLERSVAAGIFFRIMFIESLYTSFISFLLFRYAERRFNL